MAALALGTSPPSTVTAGANATGVEVTQNEHGVKVLIDGELFTQYRTDLGAKPICWPVYSATGAEVTRRFPMETIDGEKHDHPHQRSWWFTHGDVNGIDFWSENEGHGTIVHREYLALESGSQQGRIRTRNDWLAPDGTKVCEDERELRVYHRPDARVVDFDVTVRATEGPVKFGDTKEGTMGVRVATSMDVNSNLGGRIVNSRGQTDLEAWGKQAEWVDYYGPVGDETLGIAIMNHPTSFWFDLLARARVRSLRRQPLRAASLQELRRRRRQLHSQKRRFRNVPLPPLHPLRQYRTGPSGRGIRPLRGDGEVRSYERRRQQIGWFLFSRRCIARRGLLPLAPCFFFV